MRKVKRSTTSLRLGLGLPVFVTTGFFQLLCLTTDAREASTGKFEAPPVFRVNDLVVPELREGSHHTVKPEVSVIGYMYRFNVESEFGEFEAESLEGLRVRVKEINAIAELSEMSKSKVFINSLANSAKSPFVAVVGVAQNPVGTVTGLPSGAARYMNGVFRRGKKASRKASATVSKGLQAEDGEGESGNGMPDVDEVAKTAEKTGKELLGYNSAKRGLAKKLEVDPYSANPILQENLDRVAWAAFSGGFIANVAIPSVPGIGYVGDVNDAVWNTPAIELERQNDLALQAMGVAEETRWQLFEHSYFSMTAQTALVMALKRMEGVSGRPELVELVLVAESIQEVGFMVKTVGVLAAYHQLVRPLAAVAVGHGRFYGLTTQDTLILPFALDYGFWTKTARDAMKRKEYQRTRRELWLTGEVSPRGREELESRGWAVQTNCLEVFREKREEKKSDQ